MIPKHTAKKSNKCFEDSNIKLFEWLAQNPDLNQIENLNGVFIRCKSSIR